MFIYVYLYLIYIIYNNVYIHNILKILYLYCCFMLVYMLYLYYV